MNGNCLKWTGIWNSYLAEWDHIFQLDKTISEDMVWRNHISPLLGELPDNVIDIWHYGFTEIFNNAIDHSSGKM